MGIKKLQNFMLIKIKCDNRLPLLVLYSVIFKSCGSPGVFTAYIPLGLWPL